jgi:N-acetyl-gamma-glutamyl-phosphate reductase
MEAALRIAVSERLIQTPRELTSPCKAFIAKDNAALSDPIAGCGEPSHPLYVAPLSTLGRNKAMVAKIFIDGEAGTTGLQIRDRLSKRRDFELLSIPSDRRKDKDERKRLLNAADVAILCLPDDAAKESVSLIENGATRVIDASTAHRVAEGWTYGFAEMERGQSHRIAQAKRVTNPGCWPQGGIATLRPLVDAGLIPAEYPVTMHGISGYSGGGRSMIEGYEAKCWDANAFMPYGLTLQHKHVPELQANARLSNRPLFTPAVGNFRQGMIVTVPLQLWMLAKIPTGAELHAAIADHYAAISGGFVEIAPLAEASEINPELYNDTNRMRLHVFANDKTAQAVLVAVYDNLGKGACGAAVQNLNLMLGVAANTSLAA